jgi:predicted TIM-barrel fold metal-dependent hydrolase
MRLSDAHIHFAAHRRLGELQTCLAEARVGRFAAVSLPDAERINFNPEALYAKLRLGRRCFALGSFDYSARLYPGRFPGEEPDLVAQVDRLRELGFDGLKLFLGKPDFQRQVGWSLTEEPVARALERASALGLPALIHVADPPVFWTRGTLAGQQAPGYEELQAQALAVLDRHPRLTVIFAHLLMMAHDLPRLGGILAAHPNALLDLAPGLYFYGELDRRAAEAREFLIRFRSRVLFGSDGFWFGPDYDAFPYSGPAENLQRARRLADFLATERELENPFPYTREERPRLRGLGLARSAEGRRALRSIFRNNFRRLFPGRPAPVDPQACARYAGELGERVARLAGGRPGVSALRARELAELAACFRRGPGAAPARGAEGGAAGGAAG